jgi:hypothetical protein
MTKTFYAIEFRTLYDADRKWYRMAGKYTLSAAKRIISQNRKDYGWAETQFRVLKITEAQEVVFKDFKKAQATK